ncbi:MAG TPA: aldehyde dehydrogenase family protein [Pyrinomonadaceae bacterium]|jgi:acyl-CoA reductase-like NAD-dependent aldehyde dehydrogenase
MNTKKILIGGEWRAAKEDFEVKNPFTNESIARVFSADASENEEAVAIAESAAKEMRNLPRYEIAGGLRKIAARIENRKEEFARAIAFEAAKPMATARGEVERAVATFNWAAGEAERFTGEVVPIDTMATGKGRTAFTERVPRGVIYGITPFNFPLNLVGHKVAPALASKNAIIIKPSSKTPLTSLLLGEAFLESGLPKAALQVVPMDVKYIDAVLKDERVAMITFTGSAAVGWKLKTQAGRKMITLELGGNAPVIIDESADLEKSLDRNVMGAFNYAGQTCISVQRVYIHEKIFSEWTEKFVERAKKLKVGNPLDDATELSVMIDEDAAKKAETILNEAKQGGAEFLCGGGRRGAMLDAAVITDTNPEMRAVAEEIFAPVAVVEKFSDFGEAVEMSNQTKYGLQAGVFTQNLANSQYAAQNLEYGGVIINDVPTFRVDNMPYGGVRHSGFGREGARYAMEEMSEIKLVVINQ